MKKPLPDRPAQGESPDRQAAELHGGLLQSLDAYPFLSALESLTYQR